MCGCWAGARRLPTDGNLTADDFHGLFIPLMSKQLDHRLLNNLPCFIFLKKLNIENAHQSLDFVTEQHIQGLQGYTRRKKRASLRLVRARHAVNLQKLKACLIALCPGAIGLVSSEKF